MVDIGDERSGGASLRTPLPPSRPVARFIVSAAEISDKMMAAMPERAEWHAMAYLSL